MTPHVRGTSTIGRLWLSWALALATTAAPYGQTPSSPPAPTIACAVLDGDPAARAGEPLQVSNLKRVLMRATLGGLSEATGGLRLAGATASGRGAAAPTLDVVVRRTTDAARPRVEARVTETGHGAEPGRQYLDFALEIPIDRARRRANIERYLERLGDESAKAGKADEFKRLTENRETAIASFDRLYMEHMVGDYSVTCAYSPRAAGRANGAIESSPPVRLHVFFESSFFDQPVFR
jgi:hypothetical protein